VLAWIALLIGFPQVVIGMLAFFTWGWWFVAAPVLVLMPFAPNVARMRPRPEGSAAPVVAALSFASLALNVAVYGYVIRQFTLD
jgi:hypothetical protein